MDHRPRCPICSAKLSSLASSFISMNSPNKKSPQVKGIPRSQPIQPKMANAANRKPPLAPPIYRPQPTPKVLQTKRANQQSAPPVRPPQQTPKVLQAKRMKGSAPQHTARRVQGRPVSGNVVQPLWGTVAGALGGAVVGAITAPAWVPALVGAGAMAAGAVVVGAAGALVGYGGEQVASGCASGRARSSVVSPPSGGAGPSSSSSSSSSSSGSGGDNHSEELPLTNKQKFDRLVTLVNRLKDRGVYTWHARAGEFRGIEAYVNDMQKNLARNSGYAIPASVGAQLDRATTFRDEFFRWKQGAPGEAASQPYRFQEQPKQHYEIPRARRVRVVKERATVVEWLTHWGWTVNTSGQSYYNKTYGETDVHLSLPMMPADDETAVTESTASGVWIGRAVHITMQDYRPGSKNNPRIWYRSRWEKSAIPASEEDWLLTIASDITTAAGFTGVITQPVR